MAPWEWGAQWKLLPLCMSMLVLVPDLAVSSYLGCYYHPPRSHFSILADGNQWIVTPVKCRSDCRRLGYDYSGLTQGEFCFCASTPPDVTNRQPSDGNCNEACSGDPSLDCGGFQYFSVYGPVPPIRGVALQVVSPTTAVAAVTDPVSFSTSMVESPVNVSLSMDYGDGAGWTPNDAASLMQRRFAMPGIYTVSVGVTNADDMPDKSSEKTVSRKVSIQAPPEGLNVTCPEFGVVGVKFLCNATLRSGTYPTLQLDFKDGTAENLTIANIEWVAAGSAVPEHVTQATASNTNKAYAMPAAQFEEDGELMGWEVHVDTVGDAQFMVLRPECGGGQEYCFIENTCKTTGTCTSQTTVTCSSSSLYCPMRQTCVDNSTLHASTCNDVDINRYAAAVPIPTSYSVVFEETISLPSSGWAWLPTSGEGVVVHQGDIIGYGAKTGKLSTRAQNLDELEDLQETATPDLTPSNTYAAWSGVATRHLCRGLATQPTRAQFTHIYHTFGDFNISAMAVSDGLASPPVGMAVRVKVALGINVTEIEAPLYALTGNAVDFDLVPHTGTNITYMWDFGDGVNLTTEAVGASHMFATRGCYNVTVLAENVLEAKGNMSEICIQDEVIGVAVNATVSTVNVATPFLVTLTSGSDYTCEWTMGDGTLLTTDEIATPPSGLPMYYNYTREITPAANVEVNCSNDVSWDLHTLAHEAYYPINSVILVKQGGSLQHPFKLVFDVDQGTKPEFEATFSGIRYSVSYDDTHANYPTVNYVAVSTVGDYDVEVTASNLVSSVHATFNFSVVTPIVNPTLSTDPTYTILSRGESVDFTVDADAGSNIAIGVDFDDGVMETTIHPQLLTPYVFSHTFNRVGDFNVTVVVSNEFNGFTLFKLFSILVGIENVTLHTDSPVAFYRGAGVISAWFSVDGIPPNQADVVFTWGDGFQSGTQTFYTDTPYAHDYPHPAQYQVTALVSNALGQKTLTTQVSIVHPVSNMGLHVTPSHVAVNDDVTVCVSMNRGDSVTIDWDFDDAVLVSAARNGTTPYDKDCQTHRYVSTGIYSMAIGANNPLGNTTKTYTIHVQNPVTDDFVFSSTAPAAFPSDVTVTLSYPGAHAILPDNASVTFDFGDGTTLKSSSLSFTVPPYTMSITHGYSEPGHYVVTAHVWNLASSLEFTTEGGVYEDFVDLAVRADYQPLIPYGGPFIEPDTGYFPSSRDVRFFMTMTQGTVVEYIATALHLDTSVVYTCQNDTYPLLSLTKGGTYDVTVTASNPLFNSTVTTQVKVSVAVTGLRILDGNTVTKANERKYFDIRFEIIGPNACLEVDFGDDSPLTYYEEVGGECARLWPDISGQLLGTLLSDHQVDVHHVFNSSGTFTAVARAVSDVASVTDSVTFSVTSSDCARPTVTIRDSAPIFYQPNNAMKSKRIKTQGMTDITCGVTFDNTKVWTVHRISPENGSVLEHIDVTGQSSVRNSEFVLPPRFLEYGLYRFTYNVSMNIDDEYFTSVAHTHINVTKTPLIGLLIMGGMSEISVGWGNTVTLTPEAVSMDPDLDPNVDQEFTKFEWFCRQEDEVFPVGLDGELSRANATKPLSEAVWSAQPDNGGCFRQGPGPIEPLNANLSTVLGSIEIDTNSMHENETYNVTVIIHKGERRTAASVLLDITGGDPPLVEISFKDNLWHLSPNSVSISEAHRLPLKATCSAKPCPSDSVYKWQVFRQSLQVNKWLEVENQGQFLSDLSSPEVAIGKELFDEGFKLYEHMTTYKIQLSVKHGGSAQAGQASTILRLNTAPSGGSCTISSSDSFTSVPFDIECTGYNDEDGIESYQFYTKHPDEEVENHFYFGKDPQAKGKRLPIGKYSNNYTNQVFVRIQDTRGASSVFNLGLVTVRPDSPEKLTEITNRYLDENSDFHKTMAEGDLGSIAEASQWLSASLGALSNSEQAYYKNAGVASVPGGFSVGGGSAYEVTEPKNTSNLTEEALEKLRKEYDISRDNMAKLTTTMAEKVLESTKADVPSILLACGTLARLTDQAALTPRNAQKSIATTMVDMVSTLDDQIESVALEDLLEAASLIASTSGNVLTASKFTRQTATITDEDEAEASEDFFYAIDYKSPRKEISPNDLDSAVAELRGETNTIVQSDSMDESTPQIMDTMDHISRLISKKMVPGEDRFVTQSKYACMSVEKTSGDELSQVTRALPGGDVKLPLFCDLLDEDTSCDQSQIVSFQMKSFPNNFLVNAGDEVDSSSPLLSIDLLDANSNPKSVKNARNPVELTFIYPEPIGEPRMINLTDMVNTTQDNVSDGNGFYRKYTDRSHSMLVLTRYDSRPVMTQDTQLWHYMHYLPRCNPDNKEDPESIFLTSEEIGNRTGSWYSTYIAIDEKDRCLYTDENPPNSSIGLQGNFSFAVLSSAMSCSYQKKSSWSNDGLAVDISNSASLACKTYHMTTFGSGFVVQPNKIDFGYVFSNLDFKSNPTIYITLIMVFVIYIICMIWARRQDKKDATKMGVCPLPDNNPGDKYLYEMIVSTGLRKNAGTDSKVHFVISGDYDETEAHVLTDAERKVLRRGAQDRFLLAAPRPLGKLNYMQVWHDNSGKGKFGGWYLNYIAVHDLQTKDKYFFIANRWFAVEEDDGQVDRLLPVAGAEQITEFGHLFPVKAAQNLGDEHLWFSVFARPPASRFSRVQRVSCCLCLLFTSMLANAIFYGQAPEGEGNHGINFGPFSLTPGQIYIGIVCNLVVFPINFLVVWLFRKSSPRTKRKSRIREALKRQESAYKKKGILPDDMPIPSGSRDDMRPVMPDENATTTTGSGAFAKPLRPSSAFGVNYDPNGKPQSTAVDLQGVSKHTEADKAENPKKKFALPWWCTILAWVLLWVGTLLSAIFVLFFAVTFGDHKTKQWITSLVVSFLTSIFLTQPIKVFLVALLFSIIFKKADLDDGEEDEDEEEHGLDTDEMWLHAIPAHERSSTNRKRASQRPSPADLERSREIRIKELRMYDILREILLYSFFLWILLVISYGFRDPAGFFLKDSLMTTLKDQGLGEASFASNSFEKVRTYDNWFTWAEETMIPALRSSKWYNGQQPYGLRGFLSDRVSRLMGFATIRQLRVRPELCSTVNQINEVVPSCNKPYSMFNEDTAHYDNFWTPLPAGNDSAEYAPIGFRYIPGPDMDSWPIWAKHSLYSGGGYFVNLTGEVSDMLNTLETLKANNWIDRHTRAIFLEFTVYNPMVNLFGVCTFASEFLTSGGIDYFARIEPMNLLGFFAGAKLFQLICQITYLIFILFFCIKEFRKVLKQGKRYFLEPWNWVELAVIAFSITAVVVYFYRMVMANELTAIFAESGGNAYMKFQFIGYWNQILLYMVGWLVFLATIKFIRLLRFNKRMGNLSMTLRYAAKSMLMFGIMFAIIFMAYAQFFFLVFSIELLNFSTLISSVETLLQMLVGKFNFNAMAGSSPVLGPLFFFCYVVTVYYILINMFLTILNEAFAVVRRDVSKQSNEYEMVEFIVSRFKTWTGLGSLFGSKPNQEAKKKDPNADQNGDFEASIDHFPETVDRLMNCISNVYFDYDQFEALFLSSGVNSKDAMRQLRQGKSAMRRYPGGK